MSDTFYFLAILIGDDFLENIYFYLFSLSLSDS